MINVEKSILQLSLIMKYCAELHMELMIKFSVNAFIKLKKNVYF